ncbi:MAG: Trk family potassium uptake protein [Oscillospiraceae bacterium]|nr:Trk family potassium uptake protein [Oscillospiraceae bacterium]
MIKEVSAIKRTVSPPRAVVLSFAGIILVGALLLSLPAASASGVSAGFFDALFTSTSAVCVTGLVVLQTSTAWSIFGKLVILALIQLGALGILTIMTLGLTILKHRVSLRTSLVIGAQFNQDSVGGMAELVRHVVRVTLIIEGVGAVLLAAAFFVGGAADLPHSLWYGIFHSVSAFCNAGFDILGSDSLTPFRDNAVICGVISLLIISGGIGFPMWSELLKLGKKSDLTLKIRFRRLSLHAKLVLTATAALLVVGTILFYLFEWDNPNTLGDMNFGQKLSAAWFQSVSLRTAGFNTVDQAGLMGVSKFFSCVLMLIGGSPAGTAGGLKTVTAGVIFAAVASALRGEKDVSAYGRTLPTGILQKALTVVFTMLAVVGVSSAILAFTEPQVHYLDLLFEACSAAGTVGMSAGVTSQLSLMGRVVIILCMFIGRLSPVTVVVALNIKSRSVVGGRKFPDERVIIG